ncbi:N-acetyl-gamma-glutamyl-phosphate reductase [Campylobacter californiensis]|uniref:N-acetyl-gamma-glutamyl-phosphate reductase n=1 Tax=Campylobacter californiensis TaxID=1032243 RepID=UPI001472BD85|nr:N-acetyl-gamma-glutamyl-phosphate reductase [Campylobacter sp. RM12916]MBE3609628.1 N-acetyl-gamma-glutamyl-phosphate reductase [Campylobacter sp. RM12916]
MINVGVIGVSGYTGFELIRLLLNHPEFKINYLAASSKGKIDEIFSSLRGVLDFKVSVADVTEAAQKCKLVFLALPHQEAMRYASELLELGVKVVDLSADYRLNKELYEKNYCPHLDDKNLAHAVYGLLPINRDKVKNAKLVANPGCYPTASLLAITPFLPYIDTNLGVMIDAKSGVSGAGKKPSATSHFVSVNENLNAYNPLIHRHADEIKMHLENFCQKSMSTVFVPHLVPLTRGMLVSVYAKLDKKIKPLEILREFYKNEKFIRIKTSPVSVKDVAGTHFCDIFAVVWEDKIFINSAIDNLLKGASSQALANANLMFGFDENLAMPKISQFC